jgi:hypothetical protein
MKHALTIVITLSLAMGLVACKQSPETTSQAPAPMTPFERVAADDAFLRGEIKAFIETGLEKINTNAATLDNKIMHLDFPTTTDGESAGVDYLSQVRFRYAFKDVYLVGYGEVLAEPFHGIAVVEVTVTRRVAGEGAMPVVGMKASAVALPHPLIHPDLELPADDALLTDELRTRRDELLAAPEEVLTDTFLMQVVYIASEQAWAVVETGFPQSWVPVMPQAPATPAEGVPAE